MLRSPWPQQYRPPPPRTLMALLHSVTSPGTDGRSAPSPCRLQPPPLPRLSSCHGMCSHSALARVTAWWSYRGEGHGGRSSEWRTCSREEGGGDLTRVVVGDMTSARHGLTRRVCIVVCGVRSSSRYYVTLMTKSVDAVIRIEPAHASLSLQLQQHRAIKIERRPCTNENTTLRTERVRRAPSEPPALTYLSSAFYPPG